MEGAAPEQLDASVGRTTRLVVRNDADGTPIAGALVTVERDPARTYTTGADGSCSIEFSGKTGSPHLLIEKSGFFHVKAFFAPLEELTVRLHPTGKLTGRILALDSGKPLPGAVVSMQHSTCKHCEPTVAVANGEGEYELQGVPLRFPLVNFRLEAEGFPVQWKSFELVDDGAPTEHDLLLDRGLEVEGTVLDFENGQGIPGATVSRQTTDLAGRFRIRALAREESDSIELRFSAGGYCELWANIEAEDIRRGEPLSIRLPKCALVEGTVRDATGEPVQGAFVYMNEDHIARARNESADPGPLASIPRGWRLQPPTLTQAVTSDAEGRFTLSNAVPWTYGWTLLVTAEGFEPFREFIEHSPGPGERLWRDVVLAPSPTAHFARIRGTVSLNGFGRTLGGKIFWETPEASGQADIVHGQFSAKVPPGPVALRVAVDGLPHPLEGDTLALELSAGEEIGRDVRLRLPSAQITGRVLAGGEPLVDASVIASSPLVEGGRHDYWDEIHYVARTVADGSYAIEVVDWERPYRVHLNHGNEEAGIDGVPAGTRGVDFSLPATGTLLVRILSSETGSRLDLRHFELSYQRNGGSDAGWVYVGGMIVPDSDGWYSFELLEGVLDLSLRPDRNGPFLPAAVEGVAVVAGRATQVELRVERGLDLVLQPGTPEPLPKGCSIFLLTQEEWESVSYDPLNNSWDSVLGGSLFRRSVFFEEGGPCNLEGLPAGRLRFKCFPDGLVVEPETIDLTADGPRSVEVRWRLAH